MFMTSMEKLLTEALALPEDERARLAHELLLSLDRESTESTEQSTAAWTAELRNRLQDVREGKVELIDLDEVDEYVAREIAAVRR
jgi:putative addiction module component (TIGR02574 family)